MRKKVSLKITKQGGGNVYVDDDIHSPNRRDIFFQVQLTEIFLFYCQMFSKYSLRRAEQAFFTHVERNSRNVTAASKTVEPSIKSTGPVKSPKLGKRKPSSGKLTLQSSESSKYSNRCVASSYSILVTDEAKSNSGFCIKEKEEAPKGSTEMEMVEEC